MNLPKPLQQLFKQKKLQKELYLSLTLASNHMGACVWSIGGDGVLQVASSESKRLGNASWEQRIEVGDQLIEKLSEYAGTDAIHQVVFGLPQEMLTDEGDIKKEIRPHLKKLSTLLDLSPVGFVNIDSAVVFQIKKDEGVPPSVILLHVNNSEILLSLYRVGTCVGTRTIQKTEFIVEDVETAIKSFSDEVLPSRMILFGEDIHTLEALQSQLLTHQWPNRVNFLHYPKIDVLAIEDVARAVALAGASELAKSMGIEIEEHEEPNKESNKEPKKEVTVVAQTAEEQESNPLSLDSSIEDLINDEEVKEEKKDIVEEIDEAFDKDIDTEKSVKEELEEIEIRPEDANVIAVSPEVLGFRAGTKNKPDDQGEMLPKTSKYKDGGKLQFVQMGSDIISKLKHTFSLLRIPKVSKTRMWLPVGGILIAVIIIMGLLYYFLPTVRITVGVVPQIITKDKTITISTVATTIDSEKFIIPGQKQEKSISGEKTIPVTGKKRIGDPARGTVTLYNKTTTGKSLKKGTILETSNLSFSLDSDVEVASASESIGSITFGTTMAAITATAIGEEGNIAANREFTVKGYDTSVLIARNDQVFSGGKSREATVVSRADYDQLVKLLTEELVTKAQEELAQGISGGEKLINETIKTTVTNKSFTEELDQEVKDLHGKVTITISGISYKEGDIKSLLLSLASQEMNSGYVVNESRTTTTIANPIIKKDGSISAQGTIRLVAIPNIDIESIRRLLVGKSFNAAKTILKETKGVGSAEFIFKRSLGSNILPLKATNIAIDVVVIE